jgi:Ni,Fe-hydrogenase III large subunit
MHIIDIGGMATDLGFLGVAAGMGRMRGMALRLADLLAGSRFMRGFICPGGVLKDPGEKLKEIKKNLRPLRAGVKELVEFFMDNPAVHERTENVCVVSHSLAEEFGLVGVAGRACGIEYDARQHFAHGIHPQQAPRVVVEKAGDVFSRVKVRVRELFNSIDFIDQLLDSIPDGPVQAKLPETLQPNSVGLGIVEAFRGELIHLVFTDDKGQIKRYAIKDPSFNNWTGVSIAVRDNMMADFPVCNKSFSLTYSGHDL